MSSPRLPWGRLAAEFVVIVVGVLVALSVDSWVADRQQARLEEAFLGQLHDDLTRAHEQISEQLAMTEEAEHFTLQVLEVARGERTAPNDTLGSWLIRALYFSDPQPTLSTAEALARSENLYVLRDPELRSAVVTLIDRIRQLEARLIPFEMRQVEAQSTLNSWVDPFSRGLPLSFSMISPEVDALRSDAQVPVTAELLPVFRRPEFLSLFVDVFYNHETLRWNQQEMLNATEELRAAVAAELGP